MDNFKILDTLERIDLARDHALEITIGQDERGARSLGVRYYRYRIPIAQIPVPLDEKRFTVFLDQLKEARARAIAGTDQYPAGKVVAAS